MRQTGHKDRTNRRLRRWIPLAALASVVATAGSVSVAGSAAADENRAMQLLWASDPGSRTVQFAVLGSWRCSEFFGPTCDAAAGDTFTPAESITFGDSRRASYTVTVGSVDKANDAVSGTASVWHNYPGTGPYTAGVRTYPRVGSATGHVNNPGRELRAETLVNLIGTTASPYSSLPPVVTCPASGACTFDVPATDSDQHELRWRLATTAEAGSGFTQPPGATIDATTGKYSWNTKGVTRAASGTTFYSSQVVIEELASGIVVAKTPVDFFIAVPPPPANRAPSFSGETPDDDETLPARVGEPFTFTVEATDPDEDDKVTLGVTGRPSGATFTTTPASPAKATFSWTPSAEGEHLVRLTATDGKLKAAPRIVTIDVGPAPNKAPSVDAGAAVTGAEGSAVNVVGAITDPNVGDTTTAAWSYAAGTGVDDKATCTFANPAAIDTTVTCTDDGTYTLTLKGTDKAGASATDTTTLTVTNANPVVTITSPTAGTTIGAGTTVKLSASIADPGANDSHTCAIAWGDGASGTGAVAGQVCTATHKYTAAPSTALTVTATDDDGGQGSKTLGQAAPVTERVKISGKGVIDTTRSPSFEFLAQRDGRGRLAGEVRIWAPRKSQFHGTTVTRLSSIGNEASWSGEGHWNGKHGYTFTVSVTDNRSAGDAHRRRGPAGQCDSVTVTVFDGTGNVIYTATGVLKRGDIAIAR